MAVPLPAAGSAYRSLAPAPSYLAGGGYAADSGSDLPARPDRALSSEGFLLRKASILARDGRITAEEKDIMKDAIVSGDEEILNAFDAFLKEEALRGSS
eukprot:g5065.t1